MKDCLDVYKRQVCTSVICNRRIIKGVKMEVNINNENFKSEVLSYKGIVIVDFYGTWCMPCRMLAPIVEKVAKEHNIKLAKVDIDENEELVREYNIMSVPTLKIFKDGNLINSSVGVISESTLINLLK